MNHSHLQAVAKRVVWFKTPEDTPRDVKLFLAHVMTYGTLSDISTTLQHFSEGDFEAVLNDPPAGVFDRRSWTYWNLRYRREPADPDPLSCYAGLPARHRFSVATTLEQFVPPRARSANRLSHRIPLPNKGADDARTPVFDQEGPFSTPTLISSGGGEVRNMVAASDDRLYLA